MRLTVTWQRTIHLLTTNNRCIARRHEYMSPINILLLDNARCDQGYSRYLNMLTINSFSCCCCWGVSEIYLLRDSKVGHGHGDALVKGGLLGAWLDVCGHPLFMCLSHQLLKPLSIHHGEDILSAYQKVPLLFRYRD